jgi:hypothetical protein
MIEFLTIGLTIALTFVFAVVTRSRLGKTALMLLPLWFVVIILAFHDVPSGERWKALVTSPVGALVFVPMLPLLRLLRGRT